jgi:hypothetical protein
MSKQTLEKRTLKFNNFDEVMNEIRSLQSNGYTQSGNWNLAQTASHLAEWARFPMDGFPNPIFLRPVFWIMRMTVAKKWKRQIFEDGFQSGTPTAPATVASADSVSDEDEINRLQEVFDRAAAYSGDIKPSPLFGPMDRETWFKVNLLHAEHHLGFLKPAPKTEA